MRKTSIELQRRCPVHGILVGFRYCPECASSGKPWTEAQADAASVQAALEQAADRIAACVHLERDGPEDAAYAHAVLLVLNPPEDDDLARIGKLDVLPAPQHAATKGEGL